MNSCSVSTGITSLLCFIIVCCVLNSPLQPTRIASSVDKQYWAKGTGFGTGTTASSYNMTAARTKHQLEEKYVSICFTILTEFFSLKTAPSVEGGEGVDAPEVADQVGWCAEGSGLDKDEEVKEDEDFCGVEVIETLCNSCMLPALASYLLNDSGVLHVRTHTHTHTHLNTHTLKHTHS